MDNRRPITNSSLRFVAGHLLRTAWSAPILGLGTCVLLPQMALAASSSDDATAKKTLKEDGSAEETEKEPWYLRKVHIPRTGNTQLSVRSSSYYQYFHDNNDNKVGNDQYTSFTNRVTLKSATRLKKNRRLTFAMRVDTQNMWENNRANRQGHLCSSDDKTVTPESKLTCAFGNDYRLERFSIDYSGKRIAFTVGDFNVNLGRAMGLSIRRLDQIGVDATIKGLKFRVKSKYVDVTALAGHTNRQNSDIAFRGRLADPGYLAHWCKNSGWNKADRFGNSLWSICSDFVAGGRVEIKRLPGNTKLGLHHASIFFGGYGQDARKEGETESSGKTIHMSGVDLTPGRIGGVWDTFLGGAVAIARHPGASDPGLRSYNGVALYSSNNISLGKFNVLLEGKYYNDYVLTYDLNSRRVPYAELATLERFDQWMPGGASTAGGRLRLDYLIGDTGLDLYGNAMAYAFDVKPLTEAGGSFSQNNGALAVHAFGGFEYHKHHSSFTLNLSGGYRSETLNLREEETGRRINKRSLPHFDLFTNIPLYNKGKFKHSLSITDTTWFEQLGSERKKFMRGNLLVEYTMAPIVTLSVMMGYNTEENARPGTLVLDPTRVCTHAQAKIKGECKPHIYPGGSARFNFMGSSYLQIFAGKRLGGLVCMNGACRVLPDFVGADAQLVLNF